MMTPAPSLTLVDPVAEHIDLDSPAFAACSPSPLLALPPSLQPPSSVLHSPRGRGFDNSRSQPDTPTGSGLPYSTAFASSPSDFVRASTSAHSLAATDRALDGSRFAHFPLAATQPPDYSLTSQQSQSQSPLSLFAGSAGFSVAMDKLQREREKEREREQLLASRTWHSGLSGVDEAVAV